MRTCSMRSKWPGMYSICQLVCSPIFSLASPQPELHDAQNSRHSVGFEEIYKDKLACIR
jgi:hypothetical protein